MQYCQPQGLEIKKRDSKNPPLFFAKEIDLSVAWRALLKKNITADVTVFEARVELADSLDKRKKQTGFEEPKEHWSDVFDLIFPISIETLKINNSALLFTNHDLKAPLALAIEKIELQAHNLRSRSKGERSPFYLKAKIQKHAKLDVSGELNILADLPEAQVDIKLEKFQMSSINKMLRLNVPIDITKGELSLYAEAVSFAGNAHGYAKLFFNDVDIIAPKQKYLGAKHFFIEIGTAFGNWLLKNRKTKILALRLPFDYRNGKLKIDSVEAFRSVVRNYDKTLKPDIENSVSLKK